MDMVREVIIELELSIDELVDASWEPILHKTLIIMLIYFQQMWMMLLTIYTNHYGRTSRHNLGGGGTYMVIFMTIQRISILIFDIIA